MELIIAKCSLYLKSLNNKDIIWRGLDILLLFYLIMPICGFLWQSKSLADIKYNEWRN